MRRLIIAATAAVIFLSQGSLGVAGFNSGSELLDMCAATQIDGAYHAKIAECRGYVTGVADAFNCESPSKGYRWQDPGVTMGQLVKVVVKWLNENPDKLHYGAGSLTAAALSEAFPCQP